MSDQFPYFPDHSYGLLYGRGDAEIVLWVDDKTYESLPGGEQVPDSLMNEFGTSLAVIRTMRLPTMADVHDELIRAGWEDRGSLRYDVRSGLYLLDALMLAELADDLWAEREEILESGGGLHPPPESAEWAVWAEITCRRAAAARAARILAVAAVEALVNELLAARYPQEYERLEVKGKKSFWVKVRRMLRLRGVSQDPEWLKRFGEHNDLRKMLVHHRPAWVRDQRDDHSVAPDDDLTQESVHETVSSVEEAIRGLLALFEVDVPVTHRRDGLWAMMGRISSDTPPRSRR